MYLLSPLECTNTLLIKSTNYILRTKLQVSQWEKLDALNKRRMRLESLILASMKSLERHTMNIASELSAMFEGRIEEIRGSSTTHKA